MEIAELRSQIDMDNLYVDFNVIRMALSVETAAKDLQISLSEPNKEGERRGTCPKCEKEKSFSLNVNTNRFNCFAKGCLLKGGGVIDFFAKLYGVSAKEASHLLAYVYSIQPYTLDTTPAAVAGNPVNEKPVVKTPSPPIKREVLQHSISAPQPVPQTAPPITSQHLIASIEQQLNQLKELLISQ